MKKYATVMGGGLGDVILSYLTLHPTYLADLKRREPDSFVRVAAYTVNRNAVIEFLRFCPWIDELVVADWKGNYDEYVADILDGFIDIDKLRSELKSIIPTIFLSPTEEQILSELTSEPYVAFHPFAGTPERDWRGGIDLINVIDRICDAGQRVILLGGSSVRVEGCNVCSLREKLLYQRPGLINLVNKYTVRLHASLATKAARFIGSVSCYNCAAAAMKVPSLLVTHAGNRPFFESRAGGIFSTCVDNDAKIYYLDQLPQDLPYIIEKFIQS